MKKVVSEISGIVFSLPWMIAKDHGFFEAEGIAIANEAINRTLTPAFLRYKEIEAMQRFAGEGTHTVLMPHGTNPLVNIK